MIHLSPGRWIWEEEQDGRRWGRSHLAAGYPPAYRHHMSHTGEQVFVSVCVLRRVCSGVCAHLQPVKLGPKAALVLRLFELHLDTRQEVPPHRAGKRLTHHHCCSAEVHLTTSDIGRVTDTQLKLIIKQSSRVFSVGGV